MDFCVVLSHYMYGCMIRVARYADYRPAYQHHNAAYGNHNKDK